MSLDEIKHEIVKQISVSTTILHSVPFYDYPEEKIFALEEIKHYIKGIKSIDDLKKYSKRLLQIAKEFGEQAKVAKTKTERDECLGLEKGYKMGKSIILTEIENDKLNTHPQKTSSHKTTPRIFKTLI